MIRIKDRDISIPVDVDCPFYLLSIHSHLCNDAGHYCLPHRFRILLTIDHIMQPWVKFVLIIWASPYSLLGIFIGVLGMVFGGRGRHRDGALEFYAGPTAWCVRHLPTGSMTAGITLGHVILGQNGPDLERVGLHERVHVRQFERWGPLMGPAYLLASLWVWSLGKDAYLDNPFEVEAYRIAP